MPVPSVNASYNFTVVATGAGPLSVTLAWSDFASMGMARFQLVNDLDLRVEYLGWRGGPYASSYGPGRGGWGWGGAGAGPGAGGAGGPGTKGRTWPPGPGGRGAKPAPPPGPTSWWGNMGVGRDRFNNVERVSWGRWLRAAADAGAASVRCRIVRVSGILHARVRRSTWQRPSRASTASECRRAICTWGPRARTSA